MKISLTDQFLWDIYKFLQSTEDVARFIFNPNPMKLMLGPKNPIFDKYRHDKNRRKFNDLIYYLKINDYIKIKSLENKEAILITKKGIDKALKASFKIEEKTKRKDGKWIMLIFDIPQKYKKSRKLMNSILHNLGYKMFQQSVWITPYDVSEKTEKLMQIYSLENFVKIFIIEKL